MRTKQKSSGTAAGFTLVETMISLFILGLVFSAALVTYTRGEQRAEWSGYNLAAGMMCEKTMEQFHTVLWDTQVLPVINNTTNIPRTSTNLLDLPVSGTNAVWATNTATITSFTNSSGPSYYEMITVHTTWVWQGQVFTNTLVAYRAPDQ